jgi:hypothetical protein
MDVGLRMSSKAFEDFQRVYFREERDPREGTPTHLLLRLQGDERIEAENQLIAALEKGDSWAITSLGAARCKLAAEPLKKLFARPYDENKDFSDSKVNIALALWRIEQFSQAFDEIVRVLRKRPEDIDEDGEDFSFNHFERMDAAIALREFRTPESIEELIRALDDPFNLVRCHAAESLGMMCGPYPVIQDYSIGVMSKDPVKRATAKQAILDLTKRESPPSTMSQEFRIGFQPMAHEYLYYSEGGRDFTFHIVYSERGILVRTGDYLTGILGKSVEFAEGERERIVPRLQGFFENQRMVARILDLKHEPEPKEWRSRSATVLMLPEKETVRRMESMRKSVLENYLGRIEAQQSERKSSLNWSAIILIVIPAGIFGALIGLIFQAQTTSAVNLPWVFGLLAALVAFLYTKRMS